MSDDMKRNGEQSISFEGLSDFSKLIEVLRTKFVAEKDFAGLTTNEDRVKHCLNKAEIRLGFERFTKNGLSRQTEDFEKSGEKAKTLRFEGNKCFKSKKYEESLKLYSKALLCAPFPAKETPSEELSLAFANRSAALFQLNLYADCLVDVYHALNSGPTSAQMRHTLLLRKSLCLKALNQQKEAREALSGALSSFAEQANGHKNGKDAHEEHEEEEKENKADLGKFIQASFDTFKGQPKTRLEDKYRNNLGSLSDACPDLPGASNWVKINYSSEKGRHLKVTRDVARDEVTIIESPFACSLNPQFYDQYCHHCCQELNKRLYPCQKCTLVCFCSESCANKSWDSYHRHECDYLDFLHLTGVLRLSLRLLIVAGVEEATRVAKEGLPEPEKQMKQDPSEYSSVYSLRDHSDQLSNLVSCRQALAAAFFLYIASEKMRLVDKSSPKMYYSAGGLLLKHIQQMSVNSVVMFYQPIVPGPHDIIGIDIRNQIIGTALYPTVSLLNHSCLTNTEAFFKGSTIILKTKQPLAAGEELTYCYGPVFKKIPRNERMDTLRSQYYFTCHCVACSDNVIPNLEATSFRPVLTEAYFCDSCRGPLLVNGDMGKCIKCGLSSDASELKERLNSAKKVINVGKALIQFGRGSEAEKQYKKAYRSLSKLCLPENRLMLNIASELLYCNLFIENLEAARKYCEECNRIKKVTFGPQSAEYLQGVLQVLNLRWSLQKKFEEDSTSSAHRTNSMNKRLVYKLVADSEETIRWVKEGLKQFETNPEHLLVLDSSLVSCLKELVTLENQLK